MDPCAEFTIRGVVDGRRTVARWTEGHLEADPEVLRRADVVVALGDEFHGVGGLGRLRASVEDGGLPLLLTLMRAFSHVSHVDVELTPASQAAGARVVLRCATPS